MSLSAEDVARVAHLARLRLTADELAAMTRQLSSIVDYVDLLKQVETSGVEPMAHALRVANVFRDDTVAPSLPVEQALANAPKTKTNAEGQHFYSVPAVLDGGA
jgi:aspartyl-tRNA(Asn)/glutamyl-tRNA(Gln) amidotransferase subunit C